MVSCVQKTLPKTLHKTWRFICVVLAILVAGCAAAVAQPSPEAKPANIDRNGVLILKFFLHVSKEEQRKRFLERLDDPAKRWKFSMSDIADRALWGQYMKAYEDAVRETSRPEAPWHVIPADHKWFTRLAVASIVVEAMEGLDLAYPKVEGEALAEMEKVRKALLAEDKK